MVGLSFTLERSKILQEFIKDSRVLRDLIFNKSNPKAYLDCLTLLNCCRLISLLLDEYSTVLDLAGIEGISTNNRSLIIKKNIDNKIIFSKPWLYLYGELKSFPGWSSSDYLEALCNYFVQNLEWSTNEEIPDRMSDRKNELKSSDTLETVIKDSPSLNVKLTLDTFQFTIKNSKGFVSEWFASLDAKMMKALGIFDRKESLFNFYVTKEAKRNFPEKAKELSDLLFPENSSLRDSRDRLSNFALSNLIWENIINVKKGKDLKVHYDLFCSLNYHSIRYFIENNYHEEKKKNPLHSWGYKAFSDLFFWVFNKSYLQRVDTTLIFKYADYNEFFLNKVLQHLIDTWNNYSLGDSLTFYVSRDHSDFFKLPEATREKVNFKVPGVYNLSNILEVEVTKSKGWELREKHYYNLSNSSTFKAIMNNINPEKEKPKPISGFYLTFLPEYGNSLISSSFPNNKNTAIYFYDKYKQSQRDKRYTISRKPEKTSLGIAEGTFRLEIRLGLSNYLDFYHRQFPYLNREIFDLNSFQKEISKGIHAGLNKFIEELINNKIK